MEKYNDISKITNDYLDGKLSKLHLDYNSKNTLDLIIEYQDHHSVWFDYEVILNLKNGEIRSGSHKSKGFFSKVNLERETSFENALQKYILHH
ncbi:MAG: hypothetical protein UMR38_07585 [Candidatus Izemoplasma sp.]|nr:hypothetical protein [Candidatus Izemoplasma sp.]